MQAFVCPWLALMHEYTVYILSWACSLSDIPHGDPGSLLDLLVASSLPVPTQMPSPTLPLATPSPAPRPSLHLSPFLVLTDDFPCTDSFFKNCMYLCYVCGVFYIHVCLWTTYMPGARGSQKRVSHPMGLELGIVVNLHMTDGNLSQVLWKICLYY